MVKPYHILSPIDALVKDYIIYGYYSEMNYSVEQIAVVVGLTRQMVNKIIYAIKHLYKEDFDLWYNTAKTCYLATVHHYALDK